ncbi:MAG: hypothetical protein L6R39_007021 [Caloplaca ligustica]|nr:MAG: hypothetical protein L6R39_007021 [Caloplaca ligustica]
MPSLVLQPQTNLSQSLNPANPPGLEGSSRAGGLPALKSVNQKSMEHPGATPPTPPSTSSSPRAAEKHWTSPPSSTPLASSAKSPRTKPKNGAPTLASSGARSKSRSVASESRSWMSG